MDLSADISGLIPSDLDAERGLTDCLIVDPHGSGPTSSLPQTRFPFLTLRELLGISCSRVNCVLTGLIEKGTVEKGPVEKGPVEKGPAMDGRRGAPGFRGTPGLGRSIQPDNRRSNWTTGAVHTDRTDTPNLGRAVSLAGFRVSARFSLENRGVTRHDGSDVNPNGAETGSNRLKSAEVRKNLKIARSSRDLGCAMSVLRFARYASCGMTVMGASQNSTCAR
jgi:hypothetical protein